MLVATMDTALGPMQADLSRPIDIALAVREGTDTVNCFQALPFEQEPIVAGDFVGDVAQGGPVNFRRAHLTPHGNGTHTECVGHISPSFERVHDLWDRYHFTAQLVTLWPQRRPDGERVLRRAQIEEVFDSDFRPEAFVLRTMPNGDFKRHTNWSGTNPPWLEHEAAAFLAERNVQHLLLDLPSVDREEDGGKLLAHRAFWRYPEATRHRATITELIYVPEAVPDGRYLLELQVPPIALDAVPSRPVLYPLQQG